MPGFRPEIVTLISASIILIVSLFWYDTFTSIFNYLFPNAGIIVNLVTTIGITIVGTYILVWITSKRTKPPPGGREGRIFGILEY